MSYWIVPWNKSIFNLDAAIARFKGIEWHQRNNYEIGDILFLYCTKPVGSLTYIMVVAAINLTLSEVEWDDEEFYNKEIEWVKEPPKGFARFKLLQIINNEKGLLSHTKLVENGMPYSVQAPIRIKSNLLKYILNNI